MRQRGGAGLMPRVGVGGPPGIDKDIVLACLRDHGFDAFEVRSSSLNADDCAVLVLLEPRERDWVVARQCELAVVLVHSLPLSESECAKYVLKGADAFVSVDASISELVTSVGTVAQGGSVLHPRVARTVAMMGRQQFAAAPQAGFTLRERQLVESMQAGQSIKEAAQLLGISVRTVHEAQRRLFAKIGARNRGHALSLIHASGGVPELLTGEDLRSSG